MALPRKILFAIVALSIVGCSSGTSPGTPAANVNVASQSALPLSAHIDLGTITQGESIESKAWLKNEGKAAIRVANIEKSCECLSIELSKKQIDPGERVSVHAHYDGAKEAHFVGSLLIEVSLKDESDKVVGKIEVPIKVTPASAGGQ